MEPAAKAPGKIDSLDGWRAIAILLVLLSHLPYSTSCPPALRDFIDQHVNGNIGSRFFFTISGFLITWLLLREFDSKGAINLKDFYRRRALRILPVYLGYLAVLLLLQLGNFVHEAATSWGASLSFTRNYVGLATSPSAHFWSLSVEEQFYLFWPPLLCLLLQRRKLLFSLMALIILAGPLTRLLSIPTGGNFLERLHGLRSLLRYADVLLIGCGAAFLFRSALWHPSKPRACLAALLLIIPELLPDSLTDPISFLLPLLQSLAAAELILWTITHKGLAHRLLNSRPMVALGMLSFSLYVWHMLFLDHFVPGSLAWLGQSAWYLWWIPCLLGALISYALLEWPARHFRAKRRSFPSSPAAV